MVVSLNSRLENNKEEEIIPEAGRRGERVAETRLITGVPRS